MEQVSHGCLCRLLRSEKELRPLYLLSFLLWKHRAEAQGIIEDLVLQNSCISEEERDAYEELLTQAEIQSNISTVNSK
jgi:hypothetical protein